MIKLNDEGQIVKIETEEYPVIRDVLVKKREELTALLAVVEKDIADYDALVTPVAATETEVPNVAV